jgi:hypothetical protein
MKKEGTGMRRWGDGDGETGRWGDGEMGRRGMPEGQEEGLAPLPMDPKQEQAAGASPLPDLETFQVSACICLPAFEGENL